MRWLSAVIRDRPPLERFQSLTHEQRVLEFRELDQAVLVENRVKLIQQLRDAAQDRLRGEAARAGLPHLQRQITRQRNIAPLRRTMQLSGAAIRAVKPCFMMSPMTVAQMLPGGEPVFDLVIFDEASQLPTEDAVGAVIRGWRLVVVGDPKQLPPTNFFAVASGHVPTERYDDGNPLFDDSESILEEFMGAGVPMSRLKWHYRSAHESLITYSNIQFYDAELYTFPSVDAGTSHMGLQFEFVEGRYEGAGLNLIEARRVSEEVVQFARQQLARQARGAEPLTLGVGTFNMRQQLAIQDELERLRRADPSIEPFFDRGAREPFFVKNLENIQGDERDVIFLSVTYGPGTDGRIRYNFGPLNGANGWRRLNVLVTRARQRMKVFSSMRGDQISPATAGSDGPRLLREFLVYAEHGRLDSITAGTLADTESPFEREVARELLQRGLKVLPQVGSSGYRIDLGVLDDDRPGRFVCGIECDGVAYHSAETARDRDRLREQVLEARGWTIVRVWSTDWFKDRSGQVSRMLRLIDAAKMRARDGGTEPPPAIEVTPPVLPSSVVRPPPEVGPSPYLRPIAAEYIRAEPPLPAGAGEILSCHPSMVARVVRQVVAVEAPIHVEELYQRVAAVWDTRVGSRVRAHLARGMHAAIAQGGIRSRDDFLWTDSETCTVRSRAVVRMAADRISPEEYESAIRAVLDQGHAFPRPDLIAEVRAVLGFNRTGALLERAIAGVLDGMIARGVVGEGSVGLRLREVPRP
jgi:very-short-patch-repair endonuclease